MTTTPILDAAVGVPPATLRRGSIWRQTLAGAVRRPAGAVGAAVLIAYAILAVAAPLIAPDDPSMQVSGQRLLPPGTGDHLLGTDNFSRDLLSRIIFGTRVSLTVGFAGVAIAAVIGVAAGLLTGYFGGWSDTVLNRIWDTLLAYPGILLGMLVFVINGPGLTSITIAVALVNIPIFARLVRAMVLRERGQEYVLAAELAGVHRLRIMLRHLLPNTFGPVLVQFGVAVGFGVLLEAALSFIGLGIRPPTPSWGAMLNESRDYLSQAPWLAVFPGIALALLVIALNLLTDALRSALDVKGETR